MITVAALVKMDEQWGDMDDFCIYYELDLDWEGDVTTSKEDIFAFCFRVVSPMRLRRMLEEEGILLGRGYVIMNDFDERKVAQMVERIVKKCVGRNQEETIFNVTRYFKWN